VLWQKRQKAANQLSEVLSTVRSEINQTVVKLSSIKQVQDLSQLKQSVRINDLHEVVMTGIVDTPANIQISGGQKFQSEDAVCGIKKADITCDIKQSPINEPMVDNAEQEDDQFDDWKQYLEKGGSIKLATHLMPISGLEIFVSRLKPDTRIVYLKNGFGTGFRMQEVCGFKH